MFNFLKNKETVLSEKLRKLQFKETEQKSTSKKKNISIAILTLDEISQKLDFQKVIKEIFQIEDVKIYSFRKFNKQNEPSKSHFSEKDIARNGKITNVAFDVFLKEEFDLLISFFEINNLYLEYATAFCKANYKVGFSGVNKELFQLEIASNVNNPDEFLSELKKYMIILNKLPSSKKITTTAIL